MWVTSKPHFVCVFVRVCSCFYLFSFIGTCVWFGCAERLWFPSSSVLRCFVVLSPPLYFVSQRWFLSYREILSAMWEPAGCECVCVYF